MKAIHEIQGYGVVLSAVMNYYPVEENREGIFSWGFKYLNNTFETFFYLDKEIAERERSEFIAALNAWHEFRITKKSRWW